MESKEQEILKAAETMVRLGGYNAFSFREIAKEVGIKSSSVHYHFPTKEDLGAAVAAYYTEKFMATLGDADAHIAAKRDPIKAYVKAFKDALTKDKRMCLCGLLGAEANSLPPVVAAQTKSFFDQNIQWLTRAYTARDGKKGAEAKAVQTLALLEGAMIAAIALDDPKQFDKASKLLTSLAD